MNQKSIIFGDIHGCLSELDALLEKLQLEGSERLIFVGDLINKGPDSLGVLKRVVDDLKAEVILGNHELGLIQHMRKVKERPVFDKLVEQLGDEAERWLEWAEGLPTYIEEDDFMVIHGGLLPGTHPKDLEPNTITRLRQLEEEKVPWYQLYTGEKLIIYGHWAAQGLVERKNTIGIDTGCCWGNQLTALILPEKEFVQVEAKEFYAMDEEYKQHLIKTGRWPITKN